MGTVQEHEDRLQFNWGYHDAAHDIKRGRQRTLVETGPHTPEQVSAEFNHFYFEGYKAGLSDANAGKDTSLSTQAWAEFNNQQASAGNQAAQGAK